MCLFARSTVSIHAPTRGATKATGLESQSLSFNPRAHAGRDLKGQIKKTVVYVSIHAPTRGATAVGGVTARHIGFNPRAHAGRDSDDFDQDIPF